MKLLKQKDGLITIQNEQNDQLRCPYQQKTPIQTEQGITFIEHFCNSNCAQFEIHFTEQSVIDPGDEQVEQHDNYVGLHCTGRTIPISEIKEQILHVVNPGGNIKTIN